MEQGPAPERPESRDEEFEILTGSHRKEETDLETKALLGALVVAVLAVFGVIGLRNAPDAQAGDIAGATAFNPSSILVGGSATTTLTVFDDRFGSTVTANVAAGLIITNSSVVLASNIATSCSATSALGGTSVTLTDASLDTNSTSRSPGCGRHGHPRTTAGSYTGATGAQTVGISFVLGAGGSIYNGTFATQALTCLTRSATNPNTISIRKVDQFGQPLLASFSIQQGPFWIEVARINLGAYHDSEPPALRTARAAPAARCSA